MQLKYPFKFLDSYQKEDADFFFGRKDEIDSLYKMIFQTKILVVFGTSGTGKTSLIQCGLANKFQSYDWLALNIRRGSNINSSLDKALCNESSGEFTYVDEKGPVKNLTKKIKAVYKASFRPIYLIFDQFEELYVLGSKNEQENFVDAVQEILTIEQPVKIIISVREEYLGHMYEFEKKVPQLFRKKLRVEPMNFDKVSNVIKGINDYKDSLVHIETDKIEEITKGVFERLKGDENTLTIQLPYLQVFLDKLYLSITNDEQHLKEATITLKELNKVGNFDDVMKDFLEDQVKRISKNLGSKNNKISPERIWSILSHFCTLEGTKEPISRKELIERLPNQEKKLIDKCVAAFEERRIVKISEVENLYELAHDSLALKIAEKRSEDDISKLEVKRLIVSKALLKGDLSELFTEKQLNFIQPYENNLEAELTVDEKKLIKESKKEIENLKKERERAEQQEKLEREEAERQERLDRENKEREERLERENKEREERLKREKTGRRTRRIFFLVGFVIIIFLMWRGFVGNMKLEENKIALEFYEIKDIIQSATLKMDQASKYEDKNPTLALQLDKAALFSLDSLEKLDVVQNILEKDSGRFSRLPYVKQRLASFTKKQNKEIDSIIYIRIAQIKAHADTIIKFDPAFYKIVYPTNDMNYISDTSFVNVIFPDTLANSFKIWQGKEELQNSIKNHGDILQVVFPRDKKEYLLEAMALYKDGTARFWGTNPHYEELDMMENEKITSIAPIQYKVIGYKMLAAMSNRTIKEYNLNGTQRFNDSTREKPVIYHNNNRLKLNNTIVSIAISPKRDKIFTATAEGIGIIYYADTSKIKLSTEPKKMFNLYQKDILCSAFSNNGKMIITGSKDNNVKIWDVRNGTLIKELNGHFGPITSVAFSKDDTFVYTGSMDQLFRQWRLPNRETFSKLLSKPWNKTNSLDSLFILNIIDTNLRIPKTKASAKLIKEKG